MTRPALAIACALALTACHIGTGVGDFAPAQGAAGVRGTLKLWQGPAMKVELLAVRGSALLVLRDSAPPDSQIVQIPLRLIRDHDFRQMSAYAESEQLRLASRFPWGLSDEMLHNLLAAYHQRELIVLF